VALTFDDGPDPQGTPAILEALAGLEMTATFFMLGRQARRSPAIVGEVVAAGHEIASHGFSHVPHAAMPPWMVTRDLDRGQACLEDISGRPVAAMRVPYGAASLATVAHARRRGLQLVGWSRWGYDWLPRRSPGAICRRLTDGVGGGDILLLHDADRYSASRSWAATRDALAGIRVALDAAGLEATSLRAAQSPASG
jgi:peptidoglycan/xylan/chitin deacetylase (PgdA/CDA1 family)